ncbi:hypothetical protein L873DRAFT_1787412 [Choiromyces venosus 120613-1]|uniref:Uncharacterized protein n=1 Tax=Choiromyces venosus 120613-1 TaxID=1336337 RepID=A0A3N4KAJ2_9PEZI|nr:hypothetical protein L873DRAFT_1787412 [Choiromyces venosus 120613-1]
MSKRSYGGENRPDLSGDTLTDVGLVPTIRCGGKDATAEEAKLSASGAGISDLVSLVEMENELIKTPTSSVIHEDMLLLSDFPAGSVGKTETQNGSREPSLIDHMSPEETNCLGYKFNALISTRSPKRGSGITNTVSELIMNDLKVADQAPKLEFQDCFDCLSDH